MTEHPDVERRLRDHAARAEREELPADGWTRLGEPIQGERPLVHRDRRRWAIGGGLLAAAVLVVVALVVGLGGSDEEGLSTTDRTSTTAEPARTTLPIRTTTTERPPTLRPLTNPDTFAAVVDPDGDGRVDVVLVSSDTGEVLTRIHDGARDGVNRGAGIDVAASGVVYYERRSSPDQIEVYAYDPATSTDLGLVALGSQPAVSPDGGRLAVGGPNGSVDVLDLESGARRPVVNPPVDSDGRLTELRATTDLAWSPDGSFLAVESRPINVDAFAGVDVEIVPLDGGPVIPVPTDGSPVAMPAFLADGTLMVGIGADGDAPARVVASGLGTVDLGTGAVDVWSESSDVRFLDGSPDGAWLISADATGLSGLAPEVVQSDGRILTRVVSSVAGPPGVTAAAW